MRPRDAWGEKVHDLARRRRLRLRTDSRRHWLSRLIERRRPDMERHALGANDSLTHPSGSQYATAAETNVENAIGGSTRHQGSQCATTAGTGAQHVSNGFIPPREGRYASSVDAETTSGCMSAQNA